MNTYNVAAAQLVEDFINTYDLYLDEPEHLREPDDLRHFLSAYKLEPGVAESITQQTLEAVRQLRAELRACWSADNSDEMAQALNPLLAGALVNVQVKAGEQTLSLEFDAAPDASLLQRLTLACARGLIALAQQHGLDRMRSCAAEPCQDVFVDTSRNKSRRFCSERCANRYNIAAFRDRQRQTGDENQ